MKRQNKSSNRFICKNPKILTPFDGVPEYKGEILIIRRTDILKPVRTSGSFYTMVLGTDYIENAYSICQSNLTRTNFKEVWRE
jgi:hypothetical protein